MTLHGGRGEAQEARRHYVDQGPPRSGNPEVPQGSGPHGKATRKMHMSKTSTRGRTGADTLKTRRGAAHPGAEAARRRSRGTPSTRGRTRTVTLKPRRGAARTGAEATRLTPWCTPSTRGRTGAVTLKPHRGATCTGAEATRRMPWCTPSTRGRTGAASLENRRQQFYKNQEVHRRATEPGGMYSIWNSSCDFIATKLTFLNLHLQQCLSKASRDTWARDREALEQVS